MRWDTRLRHTKAFIDHMNASGVNLTLVETQYGDRPFELEGLSGFTHIKTRASTTAWSKESAINVGIHSLPHEAEYVAWIDADVEFRDRNWAAETVHALQMQPVVQPWSEAVDLGPKGEVMTVKGRQVQTSFGWVWREFGNVVDWWRNQQNNIPYSYPHSGYAWASTMQWLNDVGGLLDFSGLGAGDHQMSLAMVGEVDKAIHGLSTPSYRAHVKAWAERAYRYTQGHVGFLHGRIEHQWHGEKSLRKYVERWDILNRYGFDPLTDVHRNRYGILELSNNKPEMRRAFEQYFLQREEDANIRHGD
jgi:hypothetical protein